ncbi:DUF3052 domain-containing protein [Kordiimonas aestuarii]|uniref:DUF3052 domain-containing protein n=1 Tax=Kordiimonas aestuarii TaxID=1005925 RepID=UPI0021D18201|nr:DUF3052 domain-containing protein [Kordiimonas aestuarii]
MAGYSGTPLIKKLGIKDGFRLRLAHTPPHYANLLGGLPVGIEEAQTDCHFVHAFYKEHDLFEAEIGDLISTIRRDGMIWISWPKKAAKVATDMSEDVVREVALPLGLVDVKVCAVDEVWSALKLVIRKELR